MADATAATTPKIEELRARLKADPKSRHFYPLAEELRKFHQLEQAEEILREGIQTHPSYLSAWISLGRVLRDRGRDHEAVEVLKRALSLDGGNVVAAKLLAQAYLGVGDKVEAIKKFKLVYALMPSDSEVEVEIDRLDREINPEKYAPEPDAAPPIDVPAEDRAEASSPFGLATELHEPAAGAPISLMPEASRFDMTDSHPFSVDEEPLGSTSEGALSSLLESPEVAVPEVEALLSSPGAQESADLSEPSSEPEPFGETAASPDLFPQAATMPLEPEAPEPDEQLFDSSAAMPATLTMAQLYESQGHDEQAAEIYRQILDHAPDNAEAKSALARTGAAIQSEEAGTLADGNDGRIKRLEQWRARVARS
ncbi:MAG: tetratricopeptide repeat protein [Thermoanaerobaculia bacterium]|jgi:tetratricopeptide (TPR) repeat protein